MSLSENSQLSSLLVLSLFDPDIARTTSVQTMAQNRFVAAMANDEDLADFTGAGL